MPPDKILISQGRLIPALILDKGAVASKIHGHRRATYRTSRNQPSGNLHIFLPGDHLTDSVLIVVGLPVASPGALPQAIVALGVKKTFLVKPGKLELMIHIGRQHEVVLILYQRI